MHDVGELKIKISGCINACGHHHVGHIGILGVDKKGEEFYQITLGGDATETAALGAIVGPAFSVRWCDGRGGNPGEHLCRPAARRRALSRYLSPRRPRAVQGEALCRSLRKDGWFEDPWIAVADDEALPANGPVIVSLDRFRAETRGAAGAGAPLGVRLKSNQLAQGDRR